MIRSVFILLLTLLPLAAAENGSAVVVLYNSNVAASKSLAEYYAQKRSVPSEHVIGLPMPDREIISREEYRKELVEPFLRKLEEAKLLSFRMLKTTNAAGREEENKVVDEAKFRYAALCFGVPYKIAEDASVKEPNPENLPASARRNQAAVDSELATLPYYYTRPALNGPLVNRFYAHTNLAHMTLRNGLLMVARLDGPTPEVARGLVDKTLQAEREGLWGRAYIDTRAIPSGEYKVGDDMLAATAKTLSRYGFEVTHDDKPELFPAATPMPQIGIYAGWYELNPAGAMASAKLEFMPGAFAYHLHSYSAQSIRNTKERWVAALLERGATCTMGTADEPFLAGTPDISVFMGRWLFDGASFGEAAYLSQRMVSWQGTVVGDPLYRPFWRRPKDHHEELEKSKEKNFEWSLLRVININLATALPPAEALKFLREQELLKTSALLNEKLGDLLKANGKWIECVEPYERALALNPTPQQRLKVALTLSSVQTNLSKTREAYDLLKGLIRDFPDYPDRIKLLQKALPLADKHGKPGEAAEFEKLLKDLSPR